MSYEDIVGQRFGKLLVLGCTDRRTKSKRRYYLCLCECGKLLLVGRDNLISGRSTKCSECRNRAGMQSVFVERGDEYGVV